MKKKLITGLSTLLLVCLLGLFTTSYADVITEDNIKNFVYNSSVEFGAPIDDSVFDRQNYINWYNAISSVINTKDFFIYASWGTQSGGVNVNLEITLQTFSNFTDIWSMNPNSGLFYIRGQYQGSQNFRYNVNTNTYTYRADYDSAVTPKGIWYSTRNIYNFLNTSQLLYSAPHAEPSDIFDGKYSALGFTFIPKPSEETASVYYFEDIPLYNASGEDLYLGQLFEPIGTNVIYWTKDNYYYRYGDWNMRQLPVDSIYLEYFTTDNDVAVYDVYLQSKYIYENTIYSSVWADGSTEPYTLAYTNFYIKNNNTIVSNGVVDVSRTFSGDYKDKYDNDLDNQEDVNNISQAINDTINQPVDVSGELGAIFSGDIYDIAGSMGFDSKVSLYFTFIEDFLKSVCNVLVDDNDVYFDYNMHGETPTRIYSSDIGLPDGHPLKIFISIILVFLTVYLLYFQFMKLFEALQTADLSNAIKSQDVSFYIFKM